ncbi:oxygen-independent coproporphyrinogen III oxidase [Meridianimarinicoccus roseus]|uniref:Coproporphyrinogen-III oxidase n=1 Tax=Meridianimarinicoccus roseus TaxID=2072018 RepID=A0A2V2L952_9RHOB|nr:oxygen-independent coproporphyrinogen III oxidase [Meridianimarinicoccus roseus]PWR01765.1 oxygen-independent coproporphyrinogen III oxidase [Meridianimarinicoccus roseus]
MDTSTQLSKLGLFDSRVPRYTSYPTSPQFTATVGAADMQRWIGAIPAGSEISLYVHVPFCRRLCWFCACRTQGTSNLATVQAYLTTLETEIALLKAHLAPGVRLSRLHWGGGTPTLLSPDMMRALADRLFDVAPMAEGGEFSVEIDPNEIDTQRLDALVAAGMTRASIGIQDFDPDIQATIGRIQPYDITRRVVEDLRDRGIASLNADILYGLPHQTSEKIADSVLRLLSLSPDRVALYGYAHVPWMARRQAMIPSDALPTPQERLALFNVAQELFDWDGYDAIGIDHFARPEDGLARAQREGRLRRNFQGYTDDTAAALVGLGASSISRFPQGFAQNSGSTGDYTKRIRAGGFAVARGHAFRGDDLLRARVIEALMCDFRVETSELTGRFGLSQGAVADLYRDALDQFAGFVQLTPRGFEIRPEGRPLTRMIARSFDAYEMAASGHSSAV